MSTRTIRSSNWNDATNERCGPPKNRHSERSEEPL